MFLNSVSLLMLNFELTELPSYFIELMFSKPVYLHLYLLLHGNQGISQTHLFILPLFLSHNVCSSFRSYNYPIYLFRYRRYLEFYIDVLRLPLEFFLYQIFLLYLMCLLLRLLDYGFKLPHYCVLL